MNKLLVSIFISLGITSFYYFQCKDKEIKEKNFNIKIGCISTISLFLSFIILSNIYSEKYELVSHDGMNDLLSGKINNIKPPF